MKKFYSFFIALLVSIVGLAQLPSLPLDFESATVNYTFTNFDGGASTKIANPQVSGINTSANVARMIKSSGNTWGGSWIGLVAPMDFSVNKIFKVKVYSPRANAKLLLKVENQTDANINAERETTCTVANAWEELTFDFSTINTSNTYQKLVFIFDNGTMGDGTANFTFLFDDIRLTTGGGGGGLTQMNLPVTFDDVTVNYGLVGFGGAEQSTIVTDPTLATNKVAKVIKTNTAELWAGTSVTALNGVVQTSFANNIPFAAGATKMNVRVWSPHAGIPVRLKVEDKNDPAKSCETEATVTVASGWQTLEFNFANQAAGTAALNFTFNYNKVSIFFNFGTTGAVAGERTYYFDDVKFGAASGGGGGLTQMDLPVTFDDVTVNYGLVGFGGAEQSTIVTDPTLASNKVAKVIKTNTAELWAGTTVTALNGVVQTSFANNIPFAAGATKMNVRVWSPHAGIPVRLKVEDKNDPAKSCETEATVTVASGWQTLEFNFANQAAGTAALNFTFNYNKVSIFFNFGTTGAVAGERTYYFDDVKFGAASGGGGGLTQMDLPVTFDDVTVNYGLVGFGGAEQSTIVTDPTLATNKVAKVIKTNTAELWAGTTVTALNGVVQTSFANNIPFAAGATKMNVRVWSPHAGIPVRLKVEDKNDPAKSCETEATVTVASGWQTLEFNFANQSAGTAALNFTFNYNKVSIFFNFGTTGAVAGERTYYFDDVKFGAASGGGGGLTQMDLPVTFDDVTVNYGLVGFGGAEQSTIVTDPTLASNKVAKVIKTNTAELWAGTTVTALNGVVQTSFANNIPFAAGATKMNVRVWSPHAGIPVRLKVEDKNDPAKSCETEATVTVASGWQTLEFNFANQAAGTAALNFTFNYNKVSIFFNFGTTGAIAGERTYYFDDVKFGAASGGGGGLTQMDLPVTFDDVTVNYGLVGFGGAEQSTIVTDPTLATNKVAKVIKTNTAELWAGTTVTALNGVVQTSFANNIPFAAGATKMNVRVWSPHAGIQVRLKVEDKTDPTKSCETEATVTVASGWQTLEFNFANQAAGTAALNLGYNFNKASIFFNFGVTGAVAGERTYYFDDVQFGAAPMAQMNMPVSFDATNVNYGLVGFGGAEQSTIVTDPTLATNKVAKVIKTNTAELWAGTTVTALNGVVQTGFGNNIPFSACNTKMSVRVWSPHAGIQVRLKVEDKADPTKSCETEATVTVANGWQTLEFNFANQAAGTAALNLAYNYNKASIFFNFGVTGAVAGERTYYFDDMQMGASNAPTAPTVTSPVTYCPNATAAALTATATAGNNLKWYTVATGGTALAAAPTPSTGTSGSTIYYVSQSTAAGCEGARAAITVVVNPAPAAPTTAPVSYCQNTTAVAVTATATSGNTIKWYTTATGGTALAAPPVPATATAGTVTYYASQTSALGCEGARAALVVTINPAPAAPAVVTPVAYCQNLAATILSATAASGNSLNWYNAPTGGTASALTPTPVTTAAGNQLFYVSQTNNNGCESQRATIAVNINALPAVPAITAAPYTRLFPGLTTTVSTTTTAGTYTWFNNGVALSGQTGSSVSVDVNSMGNYSVMVTNANGCSRTSSLLAITDSTMGRLFAYPNPAVNNFQVRYHSTVNDQQPRTLKVYDSKGAEVYSIRQVIFGAYTPIMVNTATLSNGVYSIYLIDNSGKQLASGQVVVAK